MTNTEYGPSEELSACASIVKNWFALTFARSLKLDNIRVLFTDPVYGDVAACCVEGRPVHLDPCSLAKEAIDRRGKALLDHCAAITIDSEAPVEAVRYLAYLKGAACLSATLRAAADGCDSGQSIEHWRREIDRIFHLTTGEASE